jgi:hypothetical protein
MGRDISKSYAFLFEKKGLGKLSQFVNEIYRSGKLREISSFAIWEVLHRLRLFPKSRYLKFNPGSWVELQNKEKSLESQFDSLSNFFANQGFTLKQMDCNWKFLYPANNGEMFGCIYPDDTVFYKTSDGGITAVPLEHFPYKIKTMFISSLGTILVCVKGSVYRSIDNGSTFTKILDFATPESFFRANYEVTETPAGLLMIGEYGNVWEENGWKNIANLYYSSNNGETWKVSEFLKEKGINKHVHVIQYSKLLKKLFLADGDNKKKLWISGPIESFNIEHPQWNDLTRFHFQVGGYTSMIESGKKIFFGTDYQGGTNFIVETMDGKQFDKRIVPDPYRRSPVMQLILRKSNQGEEIWATLPFSTAGSKCLLMYTVDGGKHWYRALEYKSNAYNVNIINPSIEAAETLYFAIENRINNERAVYQLSDRPTSKQDLGNE